MTQNLTLRERLRETTVYKKIGSRLGILKGYIYDRRHGVHTAPEISLKKLSIDSPNARRGGDYSGTEPRYFREIMDELGIDFEKFTFIDLGSGMGRALFLASEMPFKRIIGVEFATELNEIAQKNINNFRSPDQKCFEIESVCQDAAQFKLPDGPLVCYLFNPFDREVFESVISNIENSLKDEPREIYVLYTNPMHDDLFVNNAAFEKAGEGPWHTFHRAVSLAGTKVCVYISSFSWMEHVVH
jgi:SAM-dependent methyltransferase